VHNQAKRVHVIACGVLAIDIRNAAERLGIPLTCQFLEGGLHENPGELRRRLQEAIDTASAAGACDRIAAGYGICGRGSVGIHARTVPLAFPKAHDCIALFLGSDAAYRQEFARFPGTFYISAGWFEEKVQPKSKRSAVGPAAREDEFRRLAAKYGEENARAIVDFLNSWQRNYQRAAFIYTGANRAAAYASYAKAMAEEFGWRYEELPGNVSLLERILTAESTTREVLVVPPGHVTSFDPVEGCLKAVPAWDKHRVSTPAPVPGPAPAVAHDSERTRFGLGIDAGGTYTDAVLYHFETDSILGKSKALTTKWDFTVGIDNALAGLDADMLRKVDLVSVSTTLATNAIVEGHGQVVGLLVMPPYGIFHPSDIPHEPKAVVSGRLEIDGSEISPVDPAEIRRVAREMIERHGVGAFAVSGYAGTINPSHELLVKSLLRTETGLSVTCGNELSDLLDFRTRADTAVLNARIIPRLEKFIDEVERSLRARGIRAALMVVKGDASLMSTRTARERPIETILSGPAASVAGAIRLTRCRDALVVDVGGTTSDTAAVKDGSVRTCDSGARVGRWKTHVRALDMRTIGLGGDSLITYEKQALAVGPLRVAPAAWMGSEYPAAAAALDYLERHLDDHAGCTRPMELAALTSHADSLQLHDDERALVTLLRERPHSLAELADRTGSHHWSFLRLNRLEEHYVVQRCGLTPTDLLHVQGRFERWHTPSARRLCEMTARLLGCGTERFIDAVMDLVVRKLAVELMKKQLDGVTDPDAIDTCPACQAIVRNILDGGCADYAFSLKLANPVVGLGAPVHFFLPAAAAMLGAEAVVPPDADVANAIGAITSAVVIARQVRIRPNENGGYAVHGLPDARSFERFETAHAFAVGELERLVREQARLAGTSETRVEVSVGDSISSATDGTEIFLERTVSARLSGPPDVARLGRADG